MQQLEDPYQYQAAARKGVFRRYDTALSGFIGVAALDTALQKMGATLTHSQLGALAQAYPGASPGSVAYGSLNQALQDESPWATGRAAVASGQRLYDTAQSVPPIGPNDVRVADAVRRLARRNGNRTEGVLAALFSRYASSSLGFSGGGDGASPLGLTLPQFGLALREVFGVHMQPTELKMLHTAFDVSNDAHVRPEEFARRIAEAEQALLQGRQWGGDARTSTPPRDVKDAVDALRGSLKDESGGFLGALRSAGAGSKYAGLLSRNRGVVRSLFRNCDDDGSGSLDVGEFCAALLALQLAADDAQASRLARYFDSDGSGSIDFLELVDGFLAASGRCLETAQAMLPSLQLDLLPADQHAAPACRALSRVLVFVGRLSARQLVARHAALARTGARQLPVSNISQAKDVFHDIAPPGGRVFEIGSFVAAMGTLAPECPQQPATAAFQWFDPNADGKVSYPAWVDSLFLLGATALHAIAQACAGSPPAQLTLEHHLAQLAGMTPEQLHAEQTGQTHVQQVPPAPMFSPGTWQPEPPVQDLPTQAWQTPPPDPDAFVVSAYLDITGVSDEIDMGEDLGTWTARRRTGRSGVSSAPPPSSTSGGGMPGFAPVPRPSRPPELPPRHELAQSQPVGGTSPVSASATRSGAGSKTLSHTWGGGHDDGMGPWERSLELSTTLNSTLNASGDGTLDTSALLRASWDSVAHGSSHAPLVGQAADASQPLGRSLKWSNSARESKAQDVVSQRLGADAGGAANAGRPSLHIRVSDSHQSPFAALSTPQAPWGGMLPHVPGYMPPSAMTPGWSTPVLPSGALSSSMPGFPPGPSGMPPLGTPAAPAASTAHPLAIPSVGPDDFEGEDGQSRSLRPSVVASVGEAVRQGVLHLRAQGPLLASVQQAAAAGAQGLPCSHLQGVMAHAGLVLDAGQMLAFALHVAAACEGGVLGDTGDPLPDIGGDQLRKALVEHGLHSTQAIVNPAQLRRWISTPPVRKVAPPTDRSEPADDVDDATPRRSAPPSPAKRSTSTSAQQSLRRWTRQRDPAANAKLTKRGTSTHNPKSSTEDASGLALPHAMAKHSSLAPGANAAALKLRRMFRKALSVEGSAAVAAATSASRRGIRARGGASTSGTSTETERREAARDKVLHDAMQTLQAPMDRREQCSVAQLAAALQSYGLPGKPPSEAALTSALSSVGALPETRTGMVHVPPLLRFLFEGIIHQADASSSQHLPATMRLSALLHDAEGSSGVGAWTSQGSPRRDTAFVNSVGSPAGMALGAAAGVGDLAAWHGHEFWAQVDTLEHALTLEVKARASSISGARGARVPSVTTTAAGLRSPPAKHATFELRDAFHFLAGSASGSLSLPGLHGALHRLGLLPPAPEPYPLAPTQAAAKDEGANVVPLASTPTAVALARAVYCRLLGHEDFHGNGMPKQARSQRLLVDKRDSARPACLYDRPVYFSTLARWAVPLNGKLQNVFDRLMQHLRHTAHRGAGVVDWRKAFSAADTSSDGVLQRREFTQLLRKLVPDVSPEDVQSLANAFDRDGQGGVDLEEFVAMMRQKR